MAAWIGLIYISVVVLFFLFIAILFASCKMPTAEDSDSDFAGTYAGQASYHIPTSSAESITSTLRIEVVQSKSQMTISGTETFTGELPRSMPAITGNVSDTGFFTPQGGSRIATWEDANCGRVASTKNTLAFANQNLRITETILTSECENVLFSALLIRAQ